MTDLLFKRVVSQHVLAKTNPAKLWGGVCVEKVMYVTMYSQDKQAAVLCHGVACNVTKAFMELKMSACPFVHKRDSSNLCCNGVLDVKAFSCM